jgi:hypothetical protein
MAPLETAADQRREDGARTGHDSERKSTIPARAQQPVARIAHTRQPGVGNDRHTFSPSKFLDQLRCPSRLVVLMITDERLANVEVREQMAAMPGVFAGNEINVSQTSMARKVMSPRFPMGVATK